MDLTPGERERLIKLNEELGESMERIGVLQQSMGKACQTISKALLHGYEVRFNDEDVIAYNNRTDLERELGDVKAAIDLLEEAEDVDREVIEAQRGLKRLSIKRYMKHQDQS